jgi:hypothetical protein
MTYSVKNSAQTTTYTVNDNTENTVNTSLTFIGKNYAGYGLALNENFLYLLENFSNTVGNYPSNPVPGQLFWDNTNKYMHVYDGAAWKVIYGALASLIVNTAVSFNGITTSNGGQIIGYLTGAIGANVANSGVFTTIAASTVNAGTIGNSGATLTGTLSTAAQINITSLGILESLTVSGTTNLQGTTNGATINATNLYATTIGNIGSTLTGTLSTAAQTNITSVGTLSSLTVGGNILLSAPGAKITFNSGGGTIANNIGNSLQFYVDGGVTELMRLDNIGNLNIYGGAVRAATINAATIGNTGAILIGTLSTASQTNITSVGTLSSLTVGGAIVPSTNASINIGGTGTNYWNNVYAVNFLGTSTTAKYADLAEKYLPDADYEIGTVMMVGGIAEVTQHSGDRIRAIGVTSAYPAYKMNSDLDGGVYVALKGRVPVRVVGPVKKGQSLFGTAHGLAMATDDTTPTTFAIALEDFEGSGIGSVEAVIL